MRRVMLCWIGLLVALSVVYESAQLSSPKPSPQDGSVRPNQHSSMGNSLSVTRSSADCMTSTSLAQKNGRKRGNSHTIGAATKATQGLNQYKKTEAPTTKPTIVSLPLKYPALDVTTANDFSTTAQLPTFIDKTLLLKYVLRPKTSIVYLAPRRYGKSTNMDMMDKFFRAEVDGNGNILEQGLTRYYTLFKRLDIWKNDSGSFMQEHYAKYPVLSIDLKHVKLGLACEKKLEGITERLFLQHIYLSCSQKPGVASLFNKTFAEVSDVRIPYNPDHIIGLAHYLNLHHGREVIVLVDEFDSPAMKAVLGQEKFGKEQLTGMDILGDFLGGLLKGNGNVLVGIVTGITRIGDTSSPHLNNLLYVSIFDNETIARGYGFTDRDVQKKGEELGRTALLKEMKLMYDGYIVKDSNLTLYNTQSVVKSFSAGVVKPFWESAKGLANLKLLFNYNLFGAEIEATLEKSIRVTLTDKICIDDLHNFRDLIDGKSEISRYEQRNLFFQYLLEQGYYTVSKFVDENEKIVDMRVPNKEISNDLQKLMYKQPIFFKQKLGVNIEAIDEYTDALKELNMSRASFKRLGTAIANLLKKRMMPTVESEFGAPLFTMAKFLAPENFLLVRQELHIKRRPTEKGGGYVVFVVIPKKPHDSGLTIIHMELKFKGDSALEALEQSVRKRYDEASENLSEKEREYIGHRPIQTKLFASMAWDEKKGWEMYGLRNTTVLDKKFKVPLGSFK